MMARIETQEFECRFQRRSPASWEAGTNDFEAVSGVRAKICAFVFLEFDAKGFVKSILKHTGVEAEGRRIDTIMNEAKGRRDGS